MEFVHVSWTRDAGHAGSVILSDLRKGFLGSFAVRKRQMRSIPAMSGRSLVWITVRMGGVPPPGAPDDRFNILELRPPTELFFCFFRRSH